MIPNLKRLKEILEIIEKNWWYCGEELDEIASLANETLTDYVNFHSGEGRYYDSKISLEVCLEAIKMNELNDWENAIENIDNIVDQYKTQIKDLKITDTVNITFLENENVELTEIYIWVGKRDDITSDTNQSFLVTKEVALKIAAIEEYKEFDLKSSIFWNEDEMEDER